MADRAPIPATPRPGFHHPDVPAAVGGVLGAPVAVRYVAGFALDADRRFALLVRKNKPAWQAGRLNGVGGRIEPHDATAMDAMHREWAEEVSPDVEVTWRELLTLRSGDVEIVFFVGAADRAQLAARDQTRNDIGEVLEFHALTEVTSAGALPNLSWLLPLAAYTHDTYRPFALTETA